MGVDLSVIVKELRSITRRTGAMAVDDVRDLHALLGLNVYLDEELTPELTLDDLYRAIAALPNEDDAHIARYLFRLEAAGLEIGKRREEAVADLPIADVRQIRGDRENYILAQVGFQLYASAMAPARAGWNHGDGYVFSNFTIDGIFDATLTAQTTRYTFTIRTVRNRVEFYKFGTLMKGSRKVGPARLIRGGRTQHLLASVPVDPRNPAAGDWHIVRFNPKLPFGATPTVIIEEDAELVDGTERLHELGISIASLNVIAKELGVETTVALRAHVPRSVVARYDRHTYSLVGDIMDRPLSAEPVARTDDSPMSFQPTRVVHERRYVIDWTSALMLAPAVI